MTAKSTTLDAHLESLDELRSDIGDVRRNLAHWLASRAGASRAAEALALTVTDRTLDLARLSELPYLAALGYAFDAGLVTSQAHERVAQSLDAAARRAPATPEGTGLIDDPVTALGLSVLSRYVTHARAQAAIASALGEQVVRPSTYRDALLRALAAEATGAEVRGIAEAPTTVVDFAIVELFASLSQSDVALVFPACTRERARLALQAAGPEGRGVHLDAQLTTIALEAAQAPARSSAASSSQNPRTVRSRKVVAILTALPLEFQAVTAHLRSVVEARHEQGDIYDRGNFEGSHHSWDVFVGQVGRGNVRAAVQAQRAIDFAKPDVVLFVGIAGGIKDVALGDVVAASAVFGFETAKITDTDHLSRPEVARSSHHLVKRAEADARRGLWKLRSPSTTTAATKAIVEPIAAGEKVVASTRAAVYELLRKSFSQTVAVEMEGLGVLEAAHQNDQAVLIIRSISDLLGNKQAVDDEGWQPRAAANAAAFAFEVLSNVLL
ncbi:MAG: 5'-methylthioadenosine/S-adenosylhomocysteine nucleosidase [Microbacteriaceae bacterium]|nr:5'-methylthioadenosine/S-adenosylhomocysteine nucleosidase [Microbacteriaceae bacterium]